MQSVPKLGIHLAWRDSAPVSEAVRERITREVHDVSWTLNQMETLVFDAHQLAGAHQAWLLPRLELKLPLYDVRRRYKLVCTCLDRCEWHIEDARGRRVADVRLP